MFLFDIVGTGMSRWNNSILSTDLQYCPWLVQRQVSVNYNCYSYVVETNKQENKREIYKAFCYLYSMLMTQFCHVCIVRSIGHQRPLTLCLLFHKLWENNASLSLLKTITKMEARNVYWPILGLKAQQLY